MKVKALKDVKRYFTLEKDKEYEVIGILYFATPFFVEAKPEDIETEHIPTFVDPKYSGGALRNELVYLVETMTETGRKVVSRFNFTSFEIIDSTVPNDWRTSVIDYRDQLVKWREFSGDESHNYAISELEHFAPKIIVTGAEHLHEPQYLFDLCDDA